MIPIHELLDRIRWDPEFADAEFELGYHDRVRRCLVRVPWSRIAFEPGNRFSFTALEADGSAHDVPLHRVRAVWRNGQLIWQRPTPATDTAT